MTPAPALPTTTTPFPRQSLVLHGCDDLWHWKLARCVQVGGLHVALGLHGNYARSFHTVGVAPSRPESTSVPGSFKHACFLIDLA